MHTMNTLQAKAVGTVSLNTELSQSPDIPKGAQLGCSISRQPRTFIALFQTYPLYPWQAAGVELIWAGSMPYYSPWNIPVFVLEKLLILPHFPSEPDWFWTHPQLLCKSVWELADHTTPALDLGHSSAISRAKGVQNLEVLWKNIVHPSFFIPSILIPSFLQPESVCQHYILFGKKITGVHRVQEGNRDCLKVEDLPCSTSTDLCMRNRISDNSLALLLPMSARGGSSRYFRPWNCGMRGQDYVFHNICLPSTKKNDSFLLLH